MGISVPIAWYKHKTIKSDHLLFYALLGTFLTMPLGTSPPTVFGVLAALIWILSGTALKLKRNCFERPWFWPVLPLMVLPWIGLLYTPDPTGYGIIFAKKTHYWIYCMAAASISFSIFSTKRLIQAFLVGLAINTLVAIMQFSGIFPVINKLSYGLGLGYSTLSAYLILGILTASYYFRETEEKRTRIFLVLLMTGFFFHLIIMRGRVGFLTFILLSPFIARNFFKRFSMLKISLVCALLLGVMFLSPVVRDRVALSINQVKHHLNASPDTAWTWSPSSRTSW